MTWTTSVTCRSVACGACALYVGLRQADALIITPDVEFAASSYVHKPLADNAPLAPNSEQLVQNLLNQMRSFYMNTYQYGTRIYIVGPDQPTQRVLNTPAYDVT
jgi:hypothetical protein